MTRERSGEARLLAGVVRNEACSSLLDEVRTRCVEELRRRRAAQADLANELVGPAAAAGAGRPPGDQDTDTFLESVRRDAVVAMRRRAARTAERVLPVWFRLAAAAALGLLVGASWLFRPSREAPSIAAVPPATPVVEPPSYVVRSAPMPPGIVVRTADDPPVVEYLDDDGLLAAVPGIAIARIDLPQGGQKVIIKAPGMERIVRVN